MNDKLDCKYRYGSMSFMFSKSSFPLMFFLFCLGLFSQLLVFNEHLLIFLIKLGLLEQIKLVIGISIFRFKNDFFLVQSIILYLIILQHLLFHPQLFDHLFDFCILVYFVNLFDSGNISFHFLFSFYYFRLLEPN